MSKHIIHQISLTGIGGVQQSFIPYFQLALQKSLFKHSIFGLHDIDNAYIALEKNYVNMRRNPFRFLEFIYHLWHQESIVHLYNNLGSKQVYYLLKSLPTNRIIFHERGTVWNAQDNAKNTYLANAHKAKVILANSQASKIMLTQRFHIPSVQIRVLYNGFLSPDQIVPLHVKNKRFSVGFIGRLDTPKGVHILINAAKKLKRYDFFIAGEGVWKNYLIDLADGAGHIHFLGRVKAPLDFIQKMDIIVVPSIREPLGNAIIEAGFCKKAVIATCVDGIPEIIDHQKSGWLVKPTYPISVQRPPPNALPFPQYVVNPVTKVLNTAKEIGVDELCWAIQHLQKEEVKRVNLGETLYHKVKADFNINRYFEQLEEIYQGFR